MNADAARADRNATVRSAARGWRKAEAIGEESLKAVEAAYPDDRSRVGPVFRALLFLFTLISVNGGFGFVLALFNGFGANDEVFGPFLMVFGLGTAVATDMMITLMRRRQGGIEEAASLAAVGYLIGFVAWLLLDQAELADEAALPALFLFAALLLAAAAWRWGYPLYAGAAAAALLGAVAAVPGSRLAWIVLPLALAPWLTRLSDSETLPPAHRDSWKAVLLVGLVGVHGAVHLGSIEVELVEKIGGRWDGDTARVSDLVWWLALAGTVLVPLAYLAVGVRTRRYPFLLAGLGTGVASVITLVHYAGLEPLWAVLLGTGALLTAGIFALRRYLESGPNGERHGFTAAPLFEDAARHGWLEAGAAAVTLAPEARTLREEPGFSGGGGEFGGGGSSSEF
jgi:hypothetical protein